MTLLSEVTDPNEIQDEGVDEKLFPEIQKNLLESIFLLKESQINPKETGIFYTGTSSFSSHFPLLPFFGYLTRNDTDDPNITKILFSKKRNHWQCW